MGFDNLNAHLDLSEGYQGKLFLGKVVNNVDLLGQDRIQAKVQGLYEEGELPWVGPMKFSPFGCGATWGVYGSPAVGSDVLILLQDGDPHYPVYWSVQLHANANFKSGEAWGFLDPYGNTLKLDKDQNVKFDSASGVKLTIDKDGNLAVSSPAKMTSTAGGSHTMTAPTLTINSEVTINGKVKINGDVSTQGTLTTNGVNVGSSHTHPDPQGLNTGPPQ